MRCRAIFVSYGDQFLDYLVANVTQLKLKFVLLAVTLYLLAPECTFIGILSPADLSTSC